MPLTKATYSMIQGAPINILDFGADPTGSLDSTAAIQAAFTEAQGRCVYAPAGTYRLNSTVQLFDMYVNLIGDGIGATIFVYKGSSVAFEIRPGDILRRVTINGCSFYAGNETVSSGTAIYVAYPTQPSWSGPTVFITDVQIYSNLTGPTIPYWQRGIYLSNAWNANISNVWFNGKANDYLTTSSFIQLDENCTDVLIDRCHAFFCINCVHVTGYLEGLQIDSCVFVAVYRGFYNEPTVSILGPRITDSHINAALFAIHITAGNQYQIDNNLLYGAYDSSVAAISITDTNDGSITGNSILVTSPAGNGIIVAQSIGSAERNQIRQNQVQCASNAVWLKTNTTKNYLSDNKKFNSGVEYKSYLDQGTGNVISKRTWSATQVVSLTGGNVTESITIPIPANYFLEKPSAVFVMEGGAPNQQLIGYYEYEYAGNSATSVRVTVVNNDGSAIASGNHRFSIMASE